jgi:hypothetical protein
VEEHPYFPHSPPDVHVSGEYAMFMRSALPSDHQNIIFDHIVRPVREDDAVIFRSMKPGDRYRDVDPRYRRYELKRAQRDGR